LNRLELISKLNPHLLKLIDIVNDVGVPMEGSLFFDDQVRDINIDQIDVHKYEKALSLYRFSQDKSNILEIGFNSGFSALVFLLSNDTVKVTSVDVCSYPYIPPCYEYLRSVFGDRIKLLPGSSVDVLPDLFKEQTFDSYFIDGGHSDEVTGADFNNIIDNATDKSEILVDDYNFPLIERIVLRHVLNDQIEILTENKENITVRVKK